MSYLCADTCWECSPPGAAGVDAALDIGQNRGASLSLAGTVAVVDDEPNSKVTLGLADMVVDVEQKSKVTLSLVDMVSAKTKLRSSAQPFKSTSSPPSEVSTVIALAAEVLSSGIDITDVKVNDGGMGGTTMIVGNYCRPDPDAAMIFPLVKDALLSAAQQSEKTYILGYGNQPFNNLDPLSFSCKIGHVPAAHQHTCCWDTYEHGHCRAHTCQWDHPAETDIMRVIVMITRSA
jgi:hypothetical protein